MDKKDRSKFKRVVREDGTVITELENPVYDLTTFDKLTDETGIDTKINLKEKDMTKIIKQLMSDVTLLSNRINLMMMVMDQLVYQGSVPEAVIKSLEQALNTTDNRSAKKK